MDFLHEDGDLQCDIAEMVKICRSLAANAISNVRRQDYSPAYVSISYGNHESIVRLFYKDGQGNKICSAKILKYSFLDALSNDVKSLYLSSQGHELARNINNFVPVN